MRALAVLSHKTVLRVPTEASPPWLAHTALLDPLPTPDAEFAFVKAVQKVLWLRAGDQAGPSVLVEYLAHVYTDRSRFTEVCPMPLSRCLVAVSLAPLCPTS